MTDRHFQNTLPDYQPESRQEESEGSTGPDFFPCQPSEPILLVSSEQFLKAGLELKNAIVGATWTLGADVRSPFLYTGISGTAFVCFRSFLATRDRSHLDTCLQIVDACVAKASGATPPSFLLGRAGLVALGGAAAHLRGDEVLAKDYVGKFLEIATNPALSAIDKKIPCELLYGRVGFLWAALFINKYLGIDTVPMKTLGPVVESILEIGRANATAEGRSNPPLMYAWHGKRYWGAAHGLAGILHVLMHCQLSETDACDVRRTLKYMVDHRLPGGNYRASEEMEADRLVHWCHGAPGLAVTLCKAAEVSGGEGGFLQAAIEAGEVVWERGLLRRIGLCHGISGNAYIFLALYRAEVAGGSDGQQHLHRARAFAGFLHKMWHQLIRSHELHPGDHPYSLMEGLGGMACLFLDMANPKEARFPAYEL